MANPNKDIPVVPPGHEQRFCGLHWLERRDYDGHSHGLIALQWNPGSKTWCHSGQESQHDTLAGIDTKGWTYVAKIEMPDISAPTPDNVSAPKTSVDPTIEERARQIIIDVLCTTPETLTETTSFTSDLGCDSLDEVELVMAFEEEFGIEIADDEMEQTVTFGDALRLVASKS